jgi:hypothetical protein
VESSTIDEGVKDQIRALFQRVKPEHRQQVIDSLRRMSHDQKLSYLKGWTKSEVPTGRR